MLIAFVIVFAAVFLLCLYHVVLAAVRDGINSSKLFGKSEQEKDTT